MKTLCKPFRFGESLLISGFFVIGYFFAIDSLDSFRPLNFIYFFIATYLLVLSYYSMNSFVGYREDISNNRLHATGAQYRFLWFSSLTGLVSFSLFWTHSNLLLILAAAIFIIAYIYSAFLKYMPFAGSLIHLIAIPFKFSIGYIFVVGDFKAQPLLFSLYFGFLFSAGHIHHELIDFDSDGKNGITTTAHYLGKTRALFFYIIVTTLSFIYLLALFLFHLISLPTMLVFGSAFLIQIAVWLFLTKKRNGITHNLLLNRRAYRVIYFIAGLAFLITAW